jgi:hypothetical protein
MSVRTALLAVIAVATLGFVIGTVLERNSGESHSSENAIQAGGREERHSAEGAPAEGAKQASAESGRERDSDRESELTPLGIDIEAPVFVALAVIGSLALAAGAWLRPRELPLLSLLALTMVVVAALDIREIVHQADEGRPGLAILADCVAALHLVAVVLAAVMIREAHRADIDRPTARAGSGA